MANNDPTPRDPEAMLDALMDIAGRYRAAGIVGSPANTWSECREKFRALIEPCRLAFEVADTLDVLRSVEEVHTSYMLNRLDEKTRYPSKIDAQRANDSALAAYRAAKAKVKVK